MTQTNGFDQCQAECCRILSRDTVDEAEVPATDEEILEEVGAKLGDADGKTEDASELCSRTLLHVGIFPKFLEPFSSDCPSFSVVRTPTSTFFREPFSITMIFLGHHQQTSLCSQALYHGLFVAISPSFSVCIVSIFPLGPRVCHSLRHRRDSRSMIKTFRFVRKPSKSTTLCGSLRSLLGLVCLDFHLFSWKILQTKSWLHCGLHLSVKDVRERNEWNILSFCAIVQDVVGLEKPLLSILRGKFHSHDCYIVRFLVFVLWIFTFCSRFRDPLVVNHTSLSKISTKSDNTSTRETCFVLLHQGSKPLQQQPQRKTDNYDWFILRDRDTVRSHSHKLFHTLCSMRHVSTSGYERMCLYKLRCCLTSPGPVLFLHLLLNSLVQTYRF